MDYEIVSGCYDTLGVARRGGVTTFTLENREQKPCALLFTQQTKWQVCHACHGS